MALTVNIQILQAFCKQELISEVTKLAEFMIDLQDNDCPVQFVDNTEVDELEEKLEKFALDEPDQYVNYDAWLEWDAQNSVLEAEIEAASHKATSKLIEVSEWWLCTKRLGEKLKEHGQTVIFYEDIAFWGREFYGYDPAYDIVIKDIATELEILQGMSHDWSKYIQIET